MTGRILLMAMLGAAAARAGEATIAAKLPEKPEAFGKPITDRATWERLAKEPAWTDVVRRAESLAKTPIPPSPDSLYLDFSKTGNRSRWQRVASQRRGRINAFVLAECLENEGRFLPPLEASVAAVCEERTWVMPAHDRSLANFNGKSVDIDLGAAHLASNLAMCHYLLGDRLGDKTRTLILANLRRRIFQPYLDMVAGKRRKNWWMTTTNNWNTVCLAGVTVAGLATIESREERGVFVESAIELSRNFLRGFPPDGYCTEGLGYWNYGFGYFVVLAEVLYQATGGGVDLLARKEARMPALFGSRIHIMNHVYPAFADCRVGTRPSARLSHFIGRRLRLGADPADDGTLVSPGGDVAVALMYSLPNSATATPAAPEAKTEPPLRDWFDHAGILVGRPGKTNCLLGVALKGGHNAEHHNHNDVGSYVVVVGEEPVLLDPGGEVYTSRTFSSRRYESNVLNSFGHPVPRVAGKLQRTGRAAKAVVVSSDFTDEADILVLDLKAAYTVPELKTLRRTFAYSRRDKGGLTVKDEVALTRPQTFETALITLGRWKQLGPKSLLVYDFEEAVRVDVEASADVSFAAETIKEDTRTRSLPTRIAVRFERPIDSGSITLAVRPASLPDLPGDDALLRNGGFELDDWRWYVPADGIANISTERAASGTQSLKIVDASAETGSNVSSARVPLAEGERFELRGKVLGVSGDGVGLYVKFLDRERNLLNRVSGLGHISDIGAVGGSSGKWEAFAFPFETPKGTTHAQVWIHSYNAAKVVAYLDDLTIVPTPAAGPK
jgi:hypothetical protein